MWNKTNMIDNGLLYLLIVTAVLGISYFFFYYFIYFYHKNSWPGQPTARSAGSVCILLILSLLVYLISYSVPDIELGNRIVHAFGGGFLAYLACFLAVRDSQLVIHKLRFFVFCFMLVMTLGVVNEIVEFILQNFFNFTAAPHLNDTWLDLISNTVGALIAALCFTPLLGKSKKKT